MSKTKPAQFFSELAAAARTAEDASDITEAWYRIAGLVLHIRFAGSALVPIIDPAMAHRRIEAPTEPADLLLTCWDCASLGQPYPRSPVGKQAFLPRGEVTLLSDENFQAAYEPAGRLLSMIDVAAGQAFYCVGDAGEIPRFDVAEPIRILLSWFMRAHGRQLVHAGAVGKARGGVLLMGRSGAGKSNTSLTCLNGGLGFVSDDFCAVSSGETPMAYSLYCTAKTRESDAERSPFLRNLGPEPDPTGRDKTIHFLQQSASEALLECFPLKALLLLEQGAGPCRIAPAPASALLAGSAPDTARLLANAGGEVLRSLGQLVRRLPCYTLHLGSDPLQIAPTIAALIDDLTENADAV